MLLTSNLGNEYDNVGRYYMDHPHMSACGQIMWRDQRAREIFNMEKQRAGIALRFGVYSVFTPSARRQQELKVLNCGARIKPRGKHKRNSIEQELTALTNFSGPAEELPIDSLMLYLEHAPDRQSRIRLGDERDPLGLPRLTVAWRASSLAEHTLTNLMDLLARATGGLGRGRLQVGFQPSAFQEHSGWLAAHPSGTTRMSEDPAHGVVDVNCKVHGLWRIFFVAGSSVFPTGGFTNPTFTIVALALRLGRHLKEAFDRE